MDSLTRLTCKATIGLMEERFNLTDNKISFEELNQEIIVQNFISNANDDLPGESDHIKKNPAFLALLKYYLSNNTAANDEIFNSLKKPDKDIGENNYFRYPVLKPMDRSECDRTIILLHGLNERTWLKYLPWASGLAEKTGSAVILFPIAFHMNRSPLSWSDLRRMMPVVKERKLLLSDLESSSFANAAISYRMQFAPQRFVLSGIQTFIDIVRLLQSIKNGDINGIRENSGTDLFGYSIGATLAQVLMMTNHQGLLNKSKAFLFCGGTVLDLATPVNRAIIDNHGFLSLIQLFKDILGGRAEELRSLDRIYGNAGYKHLKSLLVYEGLKNERDSRLMEIQDRIKVLSLEKDRVMSKEAIEKTFRESGIQVETEDFPFPYTHENPFPINMNDTQVTRALESVIGKAADFYNS